MEALIRDYEKENVFFFHTLGGDQDVPNIQFKKHYRLTYPVISDNADRYRHIIRVSGITNVAVFGGDGVCVFNESFMGEGDNLTQFRGVIDDALKKITGPNRKASAFVDGGTVYAPQVKEEGRIIHERMPVVAAGPGGEVHLVYVSDAAGSNDVMLRTFAKGTWRKPVPVAASGADEYAPAAVAIEKDLVLVAYVSNEKGNYDIHTALMKSGKPRKRHRVTSSRDDAMAPSLCRGDRGDVWLSWYEWAKMGNLSRDREVFLARSSASGWSRPVQVSPPTVPTYEDHADPVVCADGRGGAWVAWAWDYHGTLPKKVPVEENSIFARHVDGKMKPGEILGVGYRGEGRARDYVPAMAVGPDGIPWVAWDNSHKASTGYGAKAIFVNRLSGSDFGDQLEAATNDAQMDSPRLVLHPGGGLYLFWGQQSRAGWDLWLRKVEDGALGERRKVEVESASPRYPTGCFDEDGKLWVAYTDVGPRKWEVRVTVVR